MGSQRAGRPRVCIVRETDHYEPFVRREANALVDAGFAVEVLCMRAPGSPRHQVVDGVRITGLPVRRHRESKLGYVREYGSFFLLATATVGLRHLRRRYAVVQANSMPDALPFTAAVPKLLGARVVAYMQEPTPELMETLHGPGRMVRILEWIEQAALRYSDHAITVTPELRERYIERGADGDRITVILNGAAAELEREGWTPSADPAPAGFTVLCHGAIEDRYGQDTIVGAAQILRDELPDVRFVITGRGSTEAELAASIVRLGLGDIVRFEGWVTKQRLNDLLHQASAGIVAQKASPYSHLVHTNKMMDYWMFGLPVIASRLEATATMYGDDTLEFYEPGSPESLAAAVRRLRGDAERCADLARNGRNAHERNGWATQRDAYVEVFRRVLGPSMPDPSGGDVKMQR